MSNKSNDKTCNSSENRIQVNSLIKCFLDSENITSYYDVILYRTKGNIFFSDVKNSGSRMFLDLVYKSRDMEIDIRDKCDKAEIILNVPGMSEVFLSMLKGKFLRDLLSVFNVDMKDHVIETADRHPRGFFMEVDTNTVDL